MTYTVDLYVTSVPRYTGVVRRVVTGLWMKFVVGVLKKKKEKWCKILRAKIGVACTKRFVFNRGTLGFCMNFACRDSGTISQNVKFVINAHTMALFASKLISRSLIHGR